MNVAYVLLYDLFFYIGGLVKDVCRCCYVCAKQIGESCGGYLGIYGKCDRHLTCLQTSKYRRGTCGKYNYCCQQQFSEEIYK